MSDFSKVQMISLSRVVVSLLVLLMAYILSPVTLVGLLAVGIMFVLTLYAFLSDAFDGHYARKWKVVSQEGKIFDPLCDAVAKLLIYWALMEMDRVWSSAVLVLAVRDFCSAYYRIYMLVLKRDLSALKGGKAKTVVQAVVAHLLLILPVFPAITHSDIIEGLSVAVIVISV